MYKLLKEELNIAYFQSEKGVVFLRKSTDGDFAFISEEYSGNIGKDIFGSLFYWNDFLVFSNSNTRQSSFWKNGKEVKRESFYSLGEAGDYLITSHKKERKKSIKILNKDFNVIFEKEFRIGGRKYLAPDLFVSAEIAKANKINIFLISEEVKFYSVDITDNYWSNFEGDEFHGEVFQIIGKWGNELLVFLGKFRLVSFDLETGKELWRIDDFIQDVSSNPIFDFSSGFMSGFVKWHLSEEENKAYLLVQNCLFELDLDEKKSQLIKNYNESGEQEWYFKNSRLYDDYITFSGTNELGKFPMVAGVIDRNTKEILWTTKCEPGVYFEEAPQIKDNKLYILDSKKTLHIFEKE